MWFEPLMYFEPPSETKQKFVIARERSERGNLSFSYPSLLNVLWITTEAY